MVFKSKEIVAQNTDDLFFMESITDQLFASDFFLNISKHSEVYFHRFLKMKLLIDLIRIVFINFKLAMK